MAQQIQKLDDIRLRKLKSFEKELGCCIVALEKQSQPASLSEKQLQALKAAETEIDALLIAYKC